MTEIIFSSLSSFEDKDPEVLPIPKYAKVSYREIANSVQICFEDGLIQAYSNKHYNIMIKKNEILIFKINYICNITKSIETKSNLFSTEKGYALNNHVVKLNEHKWFSLKPVYYINSIVHSVYDPMYEYEHEYGIDNITFVFNVVDMRKIYAETFNKLLDFLPYEMVLHIISFMDIKKKGNGYFKETDFPFDFVQEFQGEIPEILSRSQLKKLYDNGTIKVAAQGIGYNSFSAMTDESYDHVYPNDAPNALKQMFKSKKEMHMVKEKFLNDFFKVIN